MGLDLQASAITTPRWNRPEILLQDVEVLTSEKGEIMEDATERIVSMRAKAFKFIFCRPKDILDSEAEYLPFYAMPGLTRDSIVNTDPLEPDNEAKTFPTLSNTRRPQNHQAILWMI